uniref:Uncharacterized protein n=1 Tax=Glossina pallidipes TaxID=7398 RepID=A0A1B0A8D0_GLOPL
MGSQAVQQPKSNPGEIVIGLSKGTSNNEFVNNSNDHNIDRPHEGEDDQEKIAFKEKTKRRLTHDSYDISMSESRRYKSADTTLRQQEPDSTPISTVPILEQQSSFSRQQVIIITSRATSQQQQQITVSVAHQEQPQQYSGHSNNKNHQQRIDYIPQQLPHCSFNNNFKQQHHSNNNSKYQESSVLKYRQPYNGSELIVVLISPLFCSSITIITITSQQL